MIYTSTKSLQYLSVPVYTIFKNLTIIVIAYGEVLWFGGSVTPSALFSFGLMVLSSVVAAWADIQSALNGSHAALSTDAAVALSTLNAGYAWMGMNVFCSAAYVLSMRKVIKKMNFKDWDSESRWICDIRKLANMFSYVLQQPSDHSGLDCLLADFRGLVTFQSAQELSP